MIRKFKYFNVKLINYKLCKNENVALQNDSISYCEFLAECELISQLQEKLCLGNSLLAPYWLPSYHPVGHRCHIFLRNRYRKVTIIALSIYITVVR